MQSTIGTDKKVREGYEEMITEGHRHELRDKPDVFGDPASGYGREQV